MSNTGKFYKMKRYPAGTFSKINNSTDEANKVITLIANDFGNQKFASTLISQIQAARNDYSVSGWYLTGIYDVIYSENEITHIGGCIPRDPKTLETSVSSAWGYLFRDQISILYDPEKDSYKLNHAMCGNLSRGNRSGFTSFNENTPLYLMPSFEPYYGSFDGIFEIPYCYTNYSFQGVNPTDIFIINDEQYAVAFNDKVPNESSSKSTNMYNMFIYKLMLD